MKSLKYPNTRFQTLSKLRFKLARCHNGGGGGKGLTLYVCTGTGQMWSRETVSCNHKDQIKASVSGCCIPRREPTCFYGWKMGKLIIHGLGSGLSPLKRITSMQGQKVPTEVVHCNQNDQIKLSFLRKFTMPVVDDFLLPAASCSHRQAGRKNCKPSWK